MLLATILAAGLTAWPAQILQDPINASPGRLARHPDRYERQRVRVTGTLVEVKRHGQCQLNVAGRSTAAAVLCARPPACAVGTAIVVDGIFHRLVVIRGQRYYNQIVASDITCAEANQPRSEPPG